MAATGIKSLAKDTAIYGLSSIIGRFLNWALTPIHVYIFTNPAEYGKVGQLYGFVALLMVILTYGMETGFFRFMNKDDENPKTVYPTSLITLGFTSLLFIILSFIFIEPISTLIRYQEHDHILMMVVIVALDAFMAIPYAKLRYDKRPIRFAIVRLAFIFSNIFFNLFFLIVCPWIYEWNPAFIDWFYSPDYGIGYIFLANLLSTILVLIMLIPTAYGFKYNFDCKLLKRILNYSYPLLILGIAGVVSHAVVPLTYPYLFETAEEAQSQIGIYTACIKITLVIAMFTQAFRYAYEPFVFAQNKDKGDNRTYSEAMKYFVIFALLLFLAVVYYMDIIKYFVSPNYYIGLSIVPIAMIGEICFGIYFNLSIWYKLTDKTQYGATLSIVGCIISLIINILLVPTFGFIASAWAVLVSNLIIMTISYILGQKYFPINYQLKTLSFYVILTTIFYLAGTLVPIDNLFLKLGYRSILLVIFIAIIVKRDLPFSEIPIVNKYIKKK